MPSPHLSGELFEAMTGAKVTHVPYRGSTPAVTDLLGGQVHFMFAPASTALPHVRSGKLRALAVTSLKRSSLAPDLPTMDEAGLKGFESSVWVGLVLPLTASHTMRLCVALTLLIASLTYLLLSWIWLIARILHDLLGGKPRGGHPVAAGH